MSEDLKNRFETHKAGDDEDSEDDEVEDVDEEIDAEADMETESDTTETSATEPAGSESGSRPESEIPVRQRNQVTMYLGDDREDAINDLFSEANARSVLDDQGEISKNDEFYPALVDFVTDQQREEFLAFLGLDTDE